MAYEEVVWNLTTNILNTHDFHLITHLSSSDRSCLMIQECRQHLIRAIRHGHLCFLGAWRDRSSLRQPNPQRKWAVKWGAILYSRVGDKRPALILKPLDKCSWGRFLLYVITASQALQRSVCCSDDRSKNQYPIKNKVGVSPADWGGMRDKRKRWPLGFSFVLSCCPPPAGQQSQQRSQDTPPLPPRDNISPAWSGSAPGPPPRWTRPEQMPTLPQSASLNVEKQRLHFEPLPYVWAPKPILKAEPVLSMISFFRSWLTARSHRWLISWEDVDVSENANANESSVLSLKQIP